MKNALCKLLTLFFAGTLMSPIYASESSGVRRGIPHYECVFHKLVNRIPVEKKTGVYIPAHKALVFRIDSMIGRMEYTIGGYQVSIYPDGEDQYSSGSFVYFPTPAKSFGLSANVAPDTQFTMGCHELQV